MKIIIDIPEKTNDHIRSDYGHGVKGLRDEDREILCDAIYRGTPCEKRPHGEKKCPNCGNDLYEYCFMCCYEGERIKQND